ncbi:JmjC domain-containing histone demethylation protein 1 [Tulasnella sp. JGI-2019a]|nr:JmjC domain-containing histone demethylation protein 1 [Tulasnella sp. JGI-2019a]KAG9012409.1 JmjC domain-containing histone demethylation protein 1 [Tulasnella sp. JGI-2019a]KAG9031427.1 JmjC domain-containing histone demethylation protein 1 [Tulasnella sp. JGI-2019a]
MEVISRGDAEPIEMEIDSNPVATLESSSTTPQGTAAGDSIDTAIQSPSVTDVGPSVFIPTNTDVKLGSNDTFAASTTSGAEDSASTEHVSGDACPACVDRGESSKRKVKKESWVGCEGCETWYHWACVSTGNDLALVDKWYCKDCLQKNPKLTITYKLPTRKSSRKRAQPGYLSSTSTASPVSSVNKWLKVIETRPLAKDSFQRKLGSEVSKLWIQADDTAFREPFVIESPEGLGMRMPGWKEGQDGNSSGDQASGDPGGPSFCVDDVCRIVGGDTPVEVIDVATQSTSPNWTLSRWAEYYNTPPSERDKIRNVISLEVTGTPFADQITPPTLVREIDWFHQHWPLNRRGKGQFPKVQLYCLMSVANAWTDMHIDFAGSSVFYHILKGAKVFYFIRPTKSNLAAYEKWSGSEMQATTWLGDLVDEVIKVELTQGNTMFIPTGWIHAVHTPEDSLVFGGNFLHSYNIVTQLRVREIEIATRVPKKFRFPLFQRMCWYVAEHYLQLLKTTSTTSTQTSSSTPATDDQSIPQRVLEGLVALSDFLMSEIRLIESGGGRGGTEVVVAGRREAKDMVPLDRVKDPSALAREFRWRVRMAVDGESGDEGGGKGAIKGAKGKAVTLKRKRGMAGLNGKEDSAAATGGGLTRSRESSAISMLSPSDNSNHNQTPIFRNYVPREWDSVKRGSGSIARTSGVTTLAVTEANDLGARGDLETRTDTVVKLRRIGDGKKVERETVTRVKEVWTLAS